MTVSYVTSDELKATLSITETFADDDIDRAVFAASRAIDNIARRRFYPDNDAAQVRYYTPHSARIVKTDDLVTITSVQTGPGDGTFPWTLAVDTQYVAEPLNAAADGWPWTRLCATHYCQFPRARKSVRVTGKFGWATTPAAVEQATSILASKLLKRAREAPLGVFTVGGFDTVGVARIARGDPDVMMLIGAYERKLMR